MADATPDPAAVEALYRELLGEIDAEPDPAVRFRLLTPQQELFDALVSRIKVARGSALAELKGSGLTEQQIADVSGLGTRQRVQQLIADPRKKRAATSGSAPTDTTESAG